MIEVVLVLSVEGTLRVERPIDERIDLRLFFFADVSDAFVHCVPERNEGIAVFNQFGDRLFWLFGHAHLRRETIAGRCAGASATV